MPAVWKAIREGHADGMSGLFLALWFIGEVAMFGHVVLTNASWPLVLNYLANVGLVGVLVFYKVLPDPPRPEPGVPAEPDEDYGDA